MHPPIVSVVIPLFNKEESIKECINSVLNQSFQNFEIIIINDGSTDNSLDIVEKIIDPRIKIYSQANAGVSAARNHGTKQSSTELIAFLDADDLWMPFFLENILSLFREFPSARWAGTGYHFSKIGEDANRNIINLLPGQFTRGLIDQYFKVCAYSDPLINSSSVCIHKKALESIDGFPIGVYSGEDLLTWARLAIKFPLAYDTKPATIFQISGINRKPDLNFTVANELEKILKTKPQTKGLKEYLGLWYRMQAIAAIKNDNPSIARFMAVRSLNYNFFELKNLYVVTLACLPKFISHYLDSKLRKWVRAMLNNLGNTNEKS